VIFVDTGAWFASFIADDIDHAAAVGWLHGNTEPLITTDYILDELLTPFRFRGEFAIALKVGPSFFNESLANIEWVTSQDVRQAWHVFETYRDKDWSFTDCVSRVIMERLGITKAFAFDAHFLQFGTVSVLP
jgi:predicted nucleic acid-binding protein